MVEEMTEDHAVDALFAEARAEAVPLPDDLFAWIMADAQAAQAVVPLTENRSWLAAFGAMLGGWPSMAGLATVGMLGVWIGVAQPTALSDYGILPDTDTVSAYDLGDLMPGFQALGSEG